MFIGLIIILSSLLIIASNIVIYTYLKRVNKHCEDTCESKTHHLNKMIRGVLAYNFSISVLVLVLNLIDRKIINEKIPKWILKLITFIQLITTSILVIGFFVYYKKLDTENCLCLDNEKISGMHKYLGGWRYVLVILYSLSVALPLIILLFGSGIKRAIKK
jgi:hypothetical protein